MQQSVDALRAQNELAQREFGYIMEQTQLDLDDEEATSKLQIDRLMREHVEHLRAQLHIHTRFVAFSLV
jgi:galactokinase